MFVANATDTTHYTIHRADCGDTYQTMLPPWWRGPFDTYLEACLPAVKVGLTPYPCMNCEPGAKPEERDLVRALCRESGIIVDLTERDQRILDTYRGMPLPGDEVQVNDLARNSENRGKHGVVMKLDNGIVANIEGVPFGFSFHSVIIIQEGTD